MIAIREAPQAADALLAVRGLCVSFATATGWAEMVSDVSFTVKAGETLGIVGESGCGKTVTALSILGLLPRRTARVRGEIRFEGRDLASLDEPALRRVRGRRIGMVFQEPMSALDPVFTVGEQIVETLRCHFPLSRRAARERAVAALASVGIPAPGHCVEQYPQSLSGGMRQRVMIAMALVCEPRLLIADEPSTALDVTVQAQIVELLLELGSRTGIALLFITHNIGLIAESCTRMLTMYAGQVVEDGLVDDILDRPLHPYNSGLLRSLPRLSPRKTALPAIPGRVPQAADMPTGCRFAPRCRHAQTPCAEPQALTQEGDRRVRCCRHAALTLPGAAS
jgi:peptide/nickel transport system ATP-binding protein